MEMSSGLLTMRFMIVLMLWVWQRISSGEFMHMVNLIFFLVYFSLCLWPLDLENIVILCHGRPFLQVSFSLFTYIEKNW